MQVRCLFSGQAKKHTGQRLSLRLVSVPNPTGRQPSAATLYAVAKHVRPRLRNQYASQKTAEATVRDWRRRRHYGANVALQRPSALRVGAEFKFHGMRRNARPPIPIVHRNHWRISRWALYAEKTVCCRSGRLNPTRATRTPIRRRRSGKSRRASGPWAFAPPFWWTKR